MRRGPAILSTALSAALLAAGPVAARAQAAVAASDERARASEAWIDEAAAISSAGSWADAVSLLDQAVFLFPSNSDLLYLRALARAKSARPLGEALADASAAREIGGFERYSDRDAAVLQAGILVRLRRWDEALGAVSSASGSDADAALRLFRAMAISGSGDRAAFVEEIRLSIERFPEDPAFPRLYLYRAPARPSTAAERSLGELIVARSRRYAESDAEIPVLAAPLMASPSSRKDAVLAYRAIGGRSAAATLAALEYGLIDEAKAIAEFLGSGFSIRVDALSRLASLMRTPEARSSLASALASWAGSVEADRDGDGVVEEVFALKRGLVAEWRLDRDQDSAFDLVALFADGLPASIELRAGSLELRAEYDGFPYLSSARFADESGVREYSFGPGALPFAPLKMRPFIGEGRRSVYLPEPLDEPAPTERACASSALALRSRGGALSARGIDYEETVLLRGVPQSARAYREGKPYSTTSYERGFPALERSDEDGDGRFETERAYEPGEGQAPRLAWARVDTDGDGVFDYREEAAFPHRKEWDYDGDGSVDAAVYDLPDGSIRGEFSSRIDGRLDEAVTVKDGRIVGLSREGKQAALVPDSNPSAVWIGRKPFDLGPGLPEGEGIFAKSGLRYRIVRVGRFAFAEVLP